MVVAGLLIVIALAAGLGSGLMRRSVPTSPTSPAATAGTKPMFIEVHVAGWVLAPGVVSVPDGSIVADAVAAAGGLRPGARSDDINLAAGLDPGEQVVVPGPDSVPAEGGTSDGIVSLSKATTADLEVLPGVGPVLAARIVEHREATGKFETVEDLLEVSGIGEAKLASIRELVKP